MLDSASFKINTKANTKRNIESNAKIKTKTKTNIKTKRNTKSNTGQTERQRLLHLDPFPSGSLCCKAKVDPVPSVVYHQDKNPG